MAESLRLLNTLGEPNASTTVIAHALRISPGNLYYHFDSKATLLMAHFNDFQKEMSACLAGAPKVLSVDALEIFFQKLFEVIWSYRFFYRDLNNLLCRDIKLEAGINELLQQKEKAIAIIVNNLKKHKIIWLKVKDQSRLVMQIIILVSWWHNHYNVLNPREEEHIQEGVNIAIVLGVSILLSVFLPYTQGEHKLKIEKIIHD